MVKNLTCFKCHEDTAVLTYEENRTYKVSCPCGCEYSFEHSSMDCAESYHMREVELHGEIDRNATIRAKLGSKDKQLAAAVENLDAVIKIACEHDVGVCDYCADNGEECHGDDPRWHCPTMEGRKWVDDDSGPQEAREGGECST